LDGPASISCYRDGTIMYQRYYVNDKKHRTDGPAEITYCPDGKVICQSYYVNGKKTILLE